jgi:predicted HTH domain antitoxin
MIMAKTVIEIPDEKLSELEAYKDKLGEILLLVLSQMKIQDALLLYQRGIISIGRAAELSGISEQEIVRHARASGISPKWSESMLEDELR